MVWIWMTAIPAKEVGWSERKRWSSQEKGLGRQVLPEVRVGTDML
jgi:hypothetical protein